MVLTRFLCLLSGLSSVTLGLFNQGGVALGDSGWFSLSPSSSTDPPEPNPKPNILRPLALWSKNIFDDSLTKSLSQPPDRHSPYDNLSQTQLPLSWTALPAPCPGSPWCACTPTPASPVNPSGSRSLLVYLLNTKLFTKMNYECFLHLRTLLLPQIVQGTSHSGFQESHKQTIQRTLKASISSSVQQECPSRPFKGLSKHQSPNFLFPEQLSQLHVVISINNLK